MMSVRKKGMKAVTWVVPFQKGTLLYQKGANCTNMHPLGTKVYHEGTNVHPLGTKVYFLKRYRPSDSFRTFFSDSAELFSFHSCMTDTRKKTTILGNTSCSFRVILVHS